MAYVMLLIGGVAVIAPLAGWLRWRLRIVTVQGYSMLPTLAPGDRLLVRRVPLARVATGDIVVLAPPDQDGAWMHPAFRVRWIVKRAVATAGDPVPADVAPILSVAPGTPVRPGALVVLGDNRDSSTDSREFGYVDEHHLLGVVRRPIRLRDPR